MYFPLKKKNISLNHSETKFLLNFQNNTEIPILPHPGAFAKKRKFHIHEGIDIYCEEHDEVISIEDGVIVNIYPFTGTLCGTEWWNDTYAVMIEGKTGVFNYGEITPNPNLSIGDKVIAGQNIGQVTTVLKKDKGRPMNMLHLELYKHNTKKGINSWNLDSKKPEHLLDPTQILIDLANIKRS